MRMNPEEKKELDDWVEKEYPKSLKRMEQSSPFHRIGKYLIGVGILFYISFILIDISLLKTSSVIFLLAGMSVEVIA